MKKLLNLKDFSKDAIAVVTHKKKDSKNLQKVS